MAIQFARVFGAEVTAFSTSAGKEEEVRALGAHNFVNTRESKAMKEMAGTLDFILTTVNADQDWGVYIRRCAPREHFALWACRRRRSPCMPSRSSPACGPSAATPLAAPPAARNARRGRPPRRESQTEFFPMAKANEAIEKVKKNKVRYRAVLAN